MKLLGKAKKKKSTKMNQELVGEKKCGLGYEKGCREEIAKKKTSL